MSYSDEQIYSAIRKADAAGDGDAVRRLSAHLQGAKPTATVAEPEDRFGFVKGLGQQVGNTVAGAVRGAGSIGATILAPYDMARDAIDGKGVSLESNRKRRADMDAALKMLGADTDSLMFGVGKLGGEIAGTAGVGGALAKALPAAARLAPLVDAVGSAGMRAGGATGAAGVGTRALGGAITGGASAFMVNPEDAGTGAAVGAVMPGALQLGGKIGDAAGRVLRGPEQGADIAQAIKAARDAGYVIPPTQARPSLGNRLIEGLSGKITTAQNASARNQGVTNRLAAESLGLAGDTKLTPDLLADMRKTAGAAYDAIGNAGTIAPGAKYSKALDDIAAPHLKAMAGFPDAKPSPVISLVQSLKSPSFDAAAAVAKIKELRTAADDAFRTGNTDIGRASKSAAAALEDAIDEHLAKSGAQDLLAGFRDARKLIAKTYTVEKALNPTSGSVDARKLAAQLNKGKPLSSELKTAASFANQFPKASQAIEGMGSLPQTSPLDWASGMALTAGTGSPMGMIGLLARPAARGAALSPLVQNRLIQGNPSALSGLLHNDDITRAGLLAAPIWASDR